MISRMSHVCIGTRDLPAQREFFCDLLGCEILHTFVNAAGETYGLILAAGDGAMIEMFNQEAPVESPGRFIPSRICTYLFSGRRHSQDGSVFHR